ncbi:hypothetical protein H1R20_g3674, partial [Candolleomyces eurysporus]
MTTALVGSPPPFEQHVVQLESTVDSKITGVSVYSDRAEVNRVVRFSVKRGQNQAIISGLPNALSHDSLRAKALERSKTSLFPKINRKRLLPPPELKTSPELKKLQSNKKEIEQAIYRNTQAQTSLDKYLGSLSSLQTPSSKLSEIFSDYDAALSDLQKKKIGLSEELEEVEKALNEEQSKLQAAVGEQKKWNPNVSLIVTVGIFANDDGDVELGLVYAVKRTSWTARYDIRVNTQTKEKAISLVYKASIKQSSGEDWTDIPLTLETATPSFDKTLPNLNPWTIGIYRPPPPQPLLYSGSSAKLLAVPTAKARRRAASAMLDEVEEAMSAARAPPPPLPEMNIQTSAVTSKGGVSATFAVPGLITIPSDGADHGVTIATLELDAKMSWVSIPKKDTKTYLSAKIKNASEYTLLSGPANVYVDGSFISRSTIPGVSPEEKFECALGPALQLPSSNTTAAPPPTNDGASVKSGKAGGLLGSLGSGSSTSGNSEKALKAVAKSVKVTADVVAQWDRPGSDVASATEEGPDSDSEPVDLTALGKDGKISWLCSVPAQTKTNLTLQWEVSAPVSTNIAGI